MYKLATAFQLNDADFPVLLAKYVCKTVYGCTNIPSNKFISNVAKFLRKFVCVQRFVNVPIFAQSVRSSSYYVVKRCYFHFVIKVIINTRCPASFSRKVCKFVWVSVSTSLFHTSSPDVVNITIVPAYQHFHSTKSGSKFVPSASAVSAPPLTVNPGMSLHVCNVLMFVNTTYRVHKVSPYIPLSVNTSTTLVDYVSHNVRHVQHPKSVFEV